MQQIFHAPTACQGFPYPILSPVRSPIPMPYANAQLLSWTVSTNAGATNPNGRYQSARPDSNHGQPAS